MAHRTMIDRHTEIEAGTRASPRWFQPFSRLLAYGQLLSYFDDVAIFMTFAHEKKTRYRE